MNTEHFNEFVEVTAVSFGSNFEPIPRRIEHNGNSYTFIDHGMRFLIRRGEEITRLLDLSDGKAKFRLRCYSASGAWRLMTITH